MLAIRADRDKGAFSRAAARRGGDAAVLAFNVTAFS
jgi:hypothetical protein